MTGFSARGVGLRRTLACTAALLLLAGCAPPSERGVAGAADGGLVFVRQQDGHTDLYRARISDGSVRPFLVTRDEEELWPYWSPAARALVFQSRSGSQQRYDLWLWRPGDAEPRRLTSTPDRDERWPSWGPRGSRLVFAFRGAHPASGLAWIDASTGSLELIATAGGLDYFLRPVVSPGGDRVVAQQRGEDGKGSSLWLFESGSAPRRLTGDDRFEFKAYFTRDGALVFSRTRDDGRRELVYVDSEGRARESTVNEPDADTHSGKPSPARDEMAFVSDRDGSRDVFLAPLPGGESRNLTRTPDRDELAPRWSPDGERMVLTAATPGPPGSAGEQVDRESTRLVVIDREGRVLFETAGMMADWMPAW